MSWLQNEIFEIKVEKLRDRLPTDHKGDNIMALKIFAFIVLICSMAYMNKTYGDTINCPHCSGYIEIETQAREVPGAGCYCDECGMFYCHGNKCPYCGFRRK